MLHSVGRCSETWGSTCHHRFPKPLDQWGGWGSEPPLIKDFFFEKTPCYLKKWLNLKIDPYIYHISKNHWWFWQKNKISSDYLTISSDSSHRRTDGCRVAVVTLPLPLLRAWPLIGSPPAGIFFAKVLLLMVQKTGVANQLRLVVYPSIYRVWLTSQMVQDFWTINSMLCWVSERCHAFYVWFI